MIAIALSAVLVATLCGCSLVVDGVDVTDYTAAQYTTYDYFNTNSTVSCYLPAERAEELKELWEGEIKESLKKVEGLLSQDGENSDIRAFNEAAAGEILTVDAITYEALILAKQVYKETDGAFNPALALSVDLWGFSPRFSEKDYTPEKPYDREDYKKELPSEEYVDAFLSLSDFSETVIYEKDGTYYVKKSASTVVVDGETYTQALDLSGIGKGYCADLIADIMREHGFDFGYVDIGGSSISLLKNARREGQAELGEWEVSVLAPDKSGGYYFKAYLKDSSLSTSGSYQQYYEIDGVRYSHIIDGKTGAPYQSDVLTASVYGKSAALADAYSTALCVMGSNKASEFAASLKGYTYTMAVGVESGYRVLTNADGRTV